MNVSLSMLALSNDNTRKCLKGTFVGTKWNNNLCVYTEEYQYSVWTPDGRCWEDRMTLEQAEEFCRNTKDFVSK